MRTVKFDSLKSFVNWLIDHEGKILADDYGRQWKFQRFKFYFKDIGDNDVFEEGIQCLHLYGTNMKIIE